MESESTKYIIMLCSKCGDESAKHYINDFGRPMSGCCKCRVKYQTERYRALLSEDVNRRVSQLRNQSIPKRPSSLYGMIKRGEVSKVEFTQILREVKLLED